MLDHGVERVFEQQHFAAHVHRDLLRQVAASDSGCDFSNVSHLRRQVRSHEVDVVGQIFPGSCDTRHLSLAAELAFGTDLARDTRHFGRECVELIGHGIDRILQFENFALHVDRNFARQVAASHGCRHLGDIAHLCRQIAGHGVDAVGQVLPGTGNARHVGLTAEAPFGADFASNASHLAGEAVKLIHHRIEGFLQLKDFAANVDRNLARQVAAGDRGRDFGDVADLTGQVRRHRVDRVGQVFPCAANARHVGLAAELAFVPNLARHARRLGGECVELIDHGVERIFELQKPHRARPPVILRDKSPRATAVATSAMLRTCPAIRRHRVDQVGGIASGYRRRRAPWPDRRACLRCRPHARHASLRRQTR